MRRSLLFIPSNNPAMLQNADIFGADSVIFDLEDAVNITEKDNARNLLYYYLNAHTSLPMEVVVRINGLDTKYYKQDIERIVSDNIDTIMLPKATIEYVKQLDEILTEIETRKQMSKKIKVFPIIEPAILVLHVDKIASLNRVDGILLGAEDLTSDMEVVRTKKGNFATGFNGFIQFVPSFVAGLLMSIFVMLWSLLLIIPGIVAGLSYSMTYFILADNPKISGLEAIKKSKEMMKGHKWEYFCLCFSFFWWFVLCAVTFGLAYIYVAPYFNATIANYYEEIKASSEQVNSVNPSVVSE